MRSKNEDRLEQFVALSEVLTGFSKLELVGSGMPQPYYDLLIRTVGEPFLFELLTETTEIIRSAKSKGELEEAFRVRIIASSKYGPLAKNIIKMWYLATWFPLPDDWCSQHGVSTGGANQVISAEAYKAGLVWPAIGTHPPGAKQPGYGSWTQPPAGTGKARTAKGGAS